MREKKDLKFSVAVNGLYFSTLFDHGGALVILSSKLLLKLQFFFKFIFMVLLFSSLYLCYRFYMQEHTCMVKGALQASIVNDMLISTIFW